MDKDKQEKWGEELYDVIGRIEKTYGYEVFDMIEDLKDIIKRAED